MIGTGWWATSYHLPALSEHPRAELVGVVDVDSRKAETAARRFGAAHAFTDHRELLDLGVDAVVIATPHHTHFALARDALVAGADVLVEKPMVVSAADGRELVRLAGQHGRRLHVGYPTPYTAHAQALRSLVAEDALGEIQTATGLFATNVLSLYRGAVNGTMAVSDDTLWPTGTDTYSEPEFGGGQLLTQGTHCASLLLFVSGLVPETVVCRLERFDTRVDVWGSLLFTTESGAVATVATTGAVGSHHQRVEEYRFFGSAGHALLDTAAGTLRVVRYDGDSVVDYPPLEREEIYPARAPATRLVDALLGEAPVLVGGELGSLTAELLDAARASDRSGDPVAVRGDTSPVAES